MAKRKVWTIEDVRREVRKMDRKLDPKEDAFIASCMMLSAIVIESTDLNALAEFMDVNPDGIRIFHANAFKNRIFREDGVAGKNWFEDGGGIEFWLDVACCTGLMQRSAR